MANYYGRSRAYVAFQVRLTPELKEKLLKRSLETGQSQVAIVNEALERYLAALDETPEDPAPITNGGDGKSNGHI
ncbi:MAG: hypothetical protein OWU33_10445 [Firmicutes bacterium]|nr:hypothetical protein [Bacillota bacterium]